LWPCGLWAWQWRGWPKGRAPPDERGVLVGPTCLAPAIYIAPAEPEHLHLTSREVALRLRCPCAAARIPPFPSSSDARAAPAAAAPPPSHAAPRRRSPPWQGKSSGSWRGVLVPASLRFPFCSKEVPFYALYLLPFNLRSGSCSCSAPEGRGPGSACGVSPPPHWTLGGCWNAASSFRPLLLLLLLLSSSSFLASD
jgi:hypothetical protein